jgi:hypothetical protein
MADRMAAHDQHLHFSILRENIGLSSNLIKMRFLPNVTRWLRPQRKSDPVFGNLLFMRNEKHPDRSYWEGNWIFPKTEYPIEVFLPGGEDGPIRESRDFCLSLPDRFERIMELCRPELSKVFREWLNRDLPQDIFNEIKLTGFGVENSRAHPVHWNVSFETTGEKWLGITIPLVDEEVGTAGIDT